jgi:hypothetical protein
MSNKKKTAQKRKQARALKKRRERKERVAKRKPTRAPDPLARVTPLETDDYNFWLCHGANYIHSDEAEGVWKPLFEGIYSGKVPTEEEAIRQMMSKYEDAINSEDALDPVGQAVIAWVFTSAKQMRVFKDLAESACLSKHPEADPVTKARQPNNPQVWKMMAEIKRRAVKAASKSTRRGT